MDVRLIATLLGSGFQGADEDERRAVSARTRLIVLDGLKAPLMARNNWHLPWEQYVETLKPHERPMVPGSPATPDHSWHSRLIYGLIGVMIATVGGMGNAAITANVQSLQGSLGITTTEAAWLPVVFVMTNACMNLILVKFRMQYGLRLFSQIFLGVLRPGLRRPPVCR